MVAGSNPVSPTQVRGGTARRINETVHGKRGISADTALRLSGALGLSDRFWINMQADFDAEVARERLTKE